MHRVITILGFLWLGFLSSQPSFAISNSSIAKWCKPYAEQGFEVQQREDLYCMIAITNTIDLMNRNCEWIRTLNKTDSITVGNPAALDFIAAGDAPLQAAIQSFLGWSESNPSKQGEGMSETHYWWLANKWPCKLK